MPFPRFAGKQSSDPIVTPEAVMRHRVERGKPVAERVPEAMILTYQPQLLDRVRRVEPTTSLPIGGPAEVVQALDRTDGRVGVVGGFGVGAPVAVVVLEELVALGVRRFLSIGVAGGLRPDLAVGDVVVCATAVRDEGVSHHYVAGDVAAVADEGLTRRLVDHLRGDGVAHRVGRSWTIDAIFRETVAEARHYAAASVLTVEMEAAALLTVAAYRGVAMGAAFCVSDSLAGGEWEPSYGSDLLATRVWSLFRASVATLAAPWP